MAAARAVHDTYELLENILLHLPVRDMLCAERVSKVTKSLIIRSQKISQALFRKPFGVDGDYYEWECHGWVREDGLAHVPIFNPLAIRLLAFPASEFGNSTSMIHHGFVDPRDRNGQITPAHSFKALMYREASWKSMYMTQPPIPRFILDHGHGCDECRCEHTCVESEWGLVLGKIWQGLVEHWHLCPKHPMLGNCYSPNRWEFCGHEDIAQVEDEITGWGVLVRMYEEDAAWKGQNWRLQAGEERE